MATLEQMKALYMRARNVYYNDSNGKNVMTDTEFDKLEDRIRALEPRWKGLKKAGAAVNKKTKVKLPIPIFSLDKRKAHNVDDWLAKQDADYCVLSNKLDGSALEIVFTKGVPTFCATRGNGVIGGDVSYLIPHLKIPQKVGTSSFILRCEGLFSHAAFLKYKNEFDAARNAASGILNRQDVHRSLRDLSVVVLSVLQPNVKLSKALSWAKSKGFTVVPHTLVKRSALNATVLSKELTTRLAKSKYAMDGLVITLDEVNPLPKSGNPDWSVAFKSNQEALETTIRSVEWEVSAHGKLKPVAIYDPLPWDGSTLTRASAFNGKFVMDEGIGVGARITIVRSGDIIPHIQTVVKKAKPSLPSKAAFGAYTLNGADFVLDAPLENEDFRVKKIARFFTSVGVDFLRESTVRKMYGSGFTSVSKITKAKAEDFLAIPGVKITTANRIHTNIHKVLDAGIPLTTLMDASGVFPAGMGTTRFEKIASTYDLLELCKADPVDQRTWISAIPGFKDTTAEYFVKGSKKFLKWLAIVGIQPTQPKKVKVKRASTKLTGVAVSFTGYRSAEQENIVVTNGGTVVPFGARTQTLLVSPEGKASTKEDKAKAKGIPVMTWVQFARKHKV